MLIQGIQETIRESPEEEENSDKANGIKRLTKGQFRSSGERIIADAQGALPPELAADHVACGVSIDCKERRVLEEVRMSAGYEFG